MAWHVEAYARSKRLPNLEHELRKLRRAEPQTQTTVPDWKVHQDFMKAKAKKKK